ncbi:hypothetical protein D8W73_01475 [Citrobacter amalonaticus]|nr:hypothetical protein [Citrobacter amalonaticus]
MQLLTSYQSETLELGKRRINIRKFNNWLFFSTFLCKFIELTNIISIILQQAPDCDVSKITKQSLEKGLKTQLNQGA